MEEGARAAEARQAVEEIQAYLSDEVAPLLVVESAELLLARPPALGAEAIRRWVGAQLQAPGAQVTLADYLFHAVTKLQMLGRLHLIDPERLTVYLTGLIEVLVAQVPAPEQPAMRAHLERASAAEASLVSTAQVLHRAAGAAGPAPIAAGTAPALTAEMEASMRQIALMLAHRTKREGAGGEGAEIDPQLIIAAAQSARSQEELEQQLARLGRAGVAAPARLSELFGTLSRGLPNWWLAGQEGEAAFVSAPVQAMQRIVDLAPDRGTATAHFRELMQTAAEQFNEGALPRALQVLEVARRQLTGGKIDHGTAELILRSAHEDLDAGRLMAQTQDAAALPQLRRLLASYPALTPEGLLTTLDDEPDRSKRRLWLALLEAHGAPARQAALARLEQSFAETEPSAQVAWLRRNFVYLLHRIRPEEDKRPEREVRLTIRCGELGNIAPLVREAITNLGLRHHPEAEGALRQLLGRLERHLEEPVGAPYEPPELLRMLGLVVVGLVRHGTPGARRAVVEHGLRQKPHLGDTLERLGDLGTLDLSDDPQLVERLLEAMRALLPVRLLGLSLRRNEGAVHLVRALQGTPSLAVRRMFADLVRRFPGEPYGAAAAEALEAWERGIALASATLPTAARRPPPVAPAAGPSAFTPLPPAATAPVSPGVSLAGDLEAFGLPDLLQTLSGSQVSGRLVLRTREGRVIGELVLRDGLLREARVGRLPMPDAFLQLMEVPDAGTFEFSRQPTQEVPAGPSRDIMALVMEGMRRHDELQRARALVPDHAYLRPTGQRPTPPPNEQDGAFVRDLWTAAKGGGSALQCAQQVVADAYRIRNCLAYWLTNGVLEVVEARRPAPPP
jgi:hypothetical protein